jgi:hypothetical protein
VYWAPAVLEHKLERRHLPGPIEEVWNCRRLPSGLGLTPNGDYLVVASVGRWVGYLRLTPEVLYTPDDPSCPYALIFDVTTWTPIRIRVPCNPFRGWTYKVPETLFATPKSVPTKPDP